MSVMLTVLGAIISVMLVILLFYSSFLNVKSDSRMQLMLNATPLGVTFWDKNFNVIDCNQNALDMFGLLNKKEYADKFFELSPKFQSNGLPTNAMFFKNFKRAMRDGYHRFEWMHQKTNGELVPCEVTLIRDKFKNDFIILGYVRDLRELKKMMQENEHHARLFNIVNTAASILLSGKEDDTFEKILLKSFDPVGRYLDVDRVQIWRNEIVDEDLHFVLRYEWLSDFGKTCRQMPYGLHFPYSMKRTWEKFFLQGFHINAPILELPEEDREFLGYYDMKSIVIIPMLLDGDFWGLFSIDDCRNNRSFSIDEINILSSAGLMMSTAVNRNIQSIKLREADERAQIMMDAAPFCAVYWDKNINLIDCNQETVKMFGLSDKHEFIDKFYQLSPEYQPDGILSAVKAPALVKKALEVGFLRFEWTHKRIDGELIPTEITCVRIIHRDEFTVTVYVRDLREQQAKIAETRKAEIAVESSKAKSDFLARMSHEIRTPMNAILGITEIQLQDETLPQITKEALERIYNSGDLLLGIINDILDLSKIEAGKLALIVSSYDIASLIHDTVQLNIMRYESKPVDFKLEIDEKIPQLLNGDELRIKQILNNLLSNAFKYTDKGSIYLSISFVWDACGESIDNHNLILVFRISDTGQGMTSEQINRLGCEYSRFNMEANRNTEGTGLGMNITRNLIRLMNGDLDIASTPGKGSVFTVRLPQVCVNDEPIGIELADNLMKLNFANTMKIRTVQIKREFMPYGRVLIVDDVETNLYVAKGLMAPYGLSIDTAMSGFEAIEKIKQGCVYDIIFMDHMMPKMDGIESVKIIRGLNYTMPIVVLTANALAGQAEIFITCGFDDFISKPIDIRQLNFTLNKLIRDKRPSDVIKAAREQKERLYGQRNKTLVDFLLTESFLRDAKKSADFLETVYNNKFSSDDDVSMFIINIHAVKSALANVGETRLSAEAAKLEQAGRDRDINRILLELPGFLELLFVVINKFETQDRELKDKAAEGDRVLLKEKLNKIKTACSNLDRKEAKNLLAEIREKTWPHETNEQLATIARYLLHS